MAEKDIVNLAKLVGIEDDGKIAEFVDSVNKHSREYVVKPTLRLHKDWGSSAHDNNRMHWYREYALEKGFKTTPTHGTFISSHAEQYVLGLVNIIKSFNPGFNLKYSGQGLNFKRPLYCSDELLGIPGSTLNWDLREPSADENGLSFSLFGLNENNKEAITPLELKKDKAPNIIFKRLPAEESSKYLYPFINKPSLIDRKHKIFASEIKDYYSLLGVTSKEEVAFMHAGLLPPATLLECCSNEGGEPEGIYIYQNFVFHNQPKEGQFETKIILFSEPEVKKRMTYYSFKSIVMQGDLLVVSGDMICSSLDKLKLDKSPR
jgi:hypothetical protein